MTVKEIYEKTVFGSLTPAAVKDYRTTYCGGSELYLELYKKGLRKNAAKKYLEIVQLLDSEAVVVKYIKHDLTFYKIVTKRTISGPFGTPLNENEEIYIK